MDFLINLNQTSELYALTFFGGEPLINHRVLTQMIKYAEDQIVVKRGKKVFFSITTNGTLINKDIINLLKDKMGSCIISFDGTEEIQNVNRPFKNGRGSFSKVKKNIEILINNEVKFDLRATIASTCSNMIEIFNFLENLKNSFGFDFVQQAKYKHAESMKYSDNNINRLNMQYRKLMEYYYQRIISQQTIYCSNIILALRRIHFQSGKKIICSAGRSAVTINPDGTIYSCQNLSSILNANIGNIVEGINEKKLSNLKAINVDDITDCKKCWLRYLCGGGCAAEKYVVNGKISDPLDDICNLKKVQWENYMWLYQKIQNNYSDFFNRLQQPEII